MFGFPSASWLMQEEATPREANKMSIFESIQVANSLDFFRILWELPLAPILGNAYWVVE